MTALAMYNMISPDLIYGPSITSISSRPGEAALCAAGSRVGGIPARSVAGRI